MQVIEPGLAAGRQGERGGELRDPGHHLQDHLGQVDPGQHRGHPLAQVDERGRLGDGGQPGEVQPPLAVDRGVDGPGGDLRGDVAQGGVQGAGLLGQQHVRVLAQLQVGERRTLGAVPLLAGEQLRGGRASGWMPRRRSRGASGAGGRPSEHPRAAVDPAFLGQHQGLPRPG